jgi:dTDP-glucose 4,6-dehydratase
MTHANLFVTGGAGFIGSEFVRQEVKLGRYSRIFVLDALTYAGNLARVQDLIDNNSIEFIHANLVQVEAYAKAIQDSDHIVHFAAETHVDRSISSGAEFVHSNIVGTFNLIESARTDLSKKIVLVSTDEVYGSTLEDSEFEEDSKLDPSSAYSASKAAGDLLGLANFKTFNQRIMISRCTNNYGPFQDSEKLIPVVIKSILQDEEIPVYGDGMNVREWIHISDHCNALRRILSDGRFGRIYNIGTGQRLTNLELIQLIGKSLGVTPKIKFVEDRKGHDFRYALDSSRISSELDWKAEVPFESGLHSTVAWYAANRGALNL